MSDKINIFTINLSNFGDGVNKRFWEYIIEDDIVQDTNNIHYITTGSIMNCVNNNSIILGTGFISENSNIKTPHDVISVRGPLTRKKLLNFNIECPENYGDPLILMPCVYDKYSNIKDNIVGIIPHVVDRKNENYRRLIHILKREGYIVRCIDINVGDNYERLIDNINKCKYIISSSLHGVIMGLVYKKKTIFVEFSNRVIGGTFKFQDFFQSVNINYENINKYDKDIMNNIIEIDYKHLIDTGKKLISLIPFINNERKMFLTKKYEYFYLTSKNEISETEK